MGLSSEDRQRVAQLVDSLDNPDAVRQREIIDILVEMGPAIIDPLHASLTLVPPRVQTSLVRVMGKLGERASLLPLMRYVFDNEGDPKKSDARALAMKAIAHIAEPDDARRVFAFLLDVQDDPDPFVRGYAFAAMGRFGDKRAVPILQDALDSDDAFVAERAQNALDRLQDASGDALESDLDDVALLQELRGSKGGERDYWVGELLGRPNAFELTKSLVEGGGRGASIGLQLLQKLDDGRARGVALRLSQSTSDPDQLAIALRILARHLEGDANEDEIAQTKLALYSDDRFVRLAALGVAGASGDVELMERALSAASDPDPVVASTAAEALSRSARPAHRRFLPELIDAAKNSLQSREGDSAEAVRARAYLLRAIRNVVSEGGYGIGDAQSLALDLLAVEDAKPIAVTGLELLDVTTRHGGPDIPARRAVAFNHLLDHTDRDVRRRAFEVLERAAPAGYDALVDPLARRLYDADPTEAERVIRVLEKVGTANARKQIERVANEAGGEVKVAAEAALRRIRSSDDYIEAEFEASKAPSESSAASSEETAKGVGSAAPKEASGSASQSNEEEWGDW